MSDYTKATNFTAKDSLPSGNASKLVKGSELDTEFDALATASATKSDKVSSATNNNIVAMDANGNIKDAGFLISETVRTDQNHTLSGNNTFSGISTFSGTIAGASPLIFEGATADAFETTIAVTDPTADRTLTLPDASGTIATTATAGLVVQVVNVTDGAVATGTTTIPNDDTIPQNTEGDEYMTLAITPTSATNKLLIEAVWVGAHTSTIYETMALFQDSTADALAAVGDYRAGNELMTLTLRHYMTSGTTSSTTFKVRVGGSGGNTTTFNGVGGARYYGGICASSITISEITV